MLTPCGPLRPNNKGYNPIQITMTFYVRYVLNTLRCPEAGAPFLMSISRDWHSYIAKAEERNQKFREKSRMVSDHLQKTGFPHHHPTIGLLLFLPGRRGKHASWEDHILPVNRDAFLFL